MVAGTLEVQMLAQLARLTSDMSQAKGIVGGAMKDIEKSVAQAKSVLGSLGIGIGVGFFVHLVKGSIDAMDALQELGKSTNQTVETLGGLKIASLQSGADLESTASALNKLATEMGKHPEKFRALGISAKDPLEAFKQLSDIYLRLENPQQRAAVMAEALGLKWQGAAPLLAEGSKKIGEMVELGKRHSGVTEEMARQADELNDKWTLLVGSGGLLVRIVGPMLPLLNLLADELLRSSEGSKEFASNISPLVEVLRVLLVIGSDVAFVFTTIGKEISLLAEKLSSADPAKLASPLTAPFEVFRIFSDNKAKMLDEVFRKDAEATRKALDDWQAKVMGMKPGGPGAGAPPGAGGPTAAEKAAAAAAAAAFTDDGKSVKALEAEDAARIRRELATEDRALDAILKAEALAEKERAVTGAALQEGLDEEVRLRAEASAIMDAQRQKDVAAERARLELGLQDTDDLGSAEILLLKQQQDERNRILIEGYDKELEAAYEAGEIEIQIAKDVAAQKKMEQQGYFDFLGNLSSLMNTQSRKMFEVGKLASIAMALIKGGEAAVSSYAAGARIGGPWLGAAFAAASVLATANMINNIRSQQFGGGGGTPTPIGQGASGIGGMGQSAPPPPQPAGGGITLNLTVNGHILDMGDFTDTIMVPALKDAIDNRDITIIGPNSRQAAELVPS